MKMRLFDNQSGHYLAKFEADAVPQPGNYVSLPLAHYRVTAVRFQANGVVDLAVSPVAQLPPTLAED